MVTKTVRERALAAIACVTRRYGSRHLFPIGIVVSTQLGYDVARSVLDALCDAGLELVDQRRLPSKGDLP